MPRKRKVPSYCLHKASGRAVVRINGSDHYLGPYGSPESHAAYELAIAEWRSLKAQAETSCHAAQTAVSGSSVNATLTLAELILRYRDFARGYYVKNGECTKEFTEMRMALKPVRQLYGSLLAREFGPLKLQSVRQHMIDTDLSRGVINNRVNRIKRFFKWAVSEELVPPTVYEGLRCVASLKKGRTAARETGPVLPVADEHVDLILPHVAPQVAAMIQLQRLTGMRPGEVVVLRRSELAEMEDVLIYRPADHKTEWLGHARLVVIGPRGRNLLRPFLDREPESFLFSPREAEARRNSLRNAARKTPMTPSQRRRKPRQNPKRAKRENYDVDSYRRAIKYAIKKVNRQRVLESHEPIPEWFPLQLRHSRATEINEKYGIEAAAVSLGHAHADVTKVYAERNLKLAITVARATG